MSRKQGKEDVQTYLEALTYAVLAYGDDVVKQKTSGRDLRGKTKNKSG